MGKIKNLKPFEKGKSGNPKGRPKGTLNRSTLYRKYMDVKLPGANKTFGIKEGELTVADQIALKQIELAMKGNQQAYDRVMDAAFGKVADVLKTEPPDETPPDLSTQESVMRELEKALKDARR